MPGIPATRLSTFWVSASVCTSVEFSGSVIAIGTVGRGDWSRRLRGKSGIITIAARNLAAAAAIVRSSSPVAWLHTASEYHDRVIHDAPDRHHHAAQGQDVEGDVLLPEHDQRHQQ